MTSIENGTNAAPRPEFEDATVENFRAIRIIVIGAGFSGIYCGIRIPERIRNSELVIYEQNEGIGGTWWSNRYPGCACDVPAHSYQYSFSPNPNWSNFYAPAPEICAYLNDVAHKYSADRYIKCGHKVQKCSWNSHTSKWKVFVKEVTTGNVFEDEADILISARGVLNDMAWPKIPGLSSFKGPIVHSAAWSDSIDFHDKRVGIIGSGSSAIQIVPRLQKVEGIQLSCFIRSKTWISPPFGTSAVEKLGLDHEDFRDAEKRRFANDPEYFLRFRKLIESEGNSVHGLTIKDSPMQSGARHAFSEEMKNRLGNRTEIVDALIPDFAVGCRRLTPGPGYLEALSQDNVEFFSTGISEIVENGIISDGRLVEVDAIICATGFNTSGHPQFPVEGLQGLTLSSKFAPYPETYLSLATDGFPNFFMLLGPNSAIGTGSLTMMIESLGDYIVKCVRKVQKENIRSINVKPEAVKAFSRYIDNYFQKTVYLDRCRSWYRSDGGAGNRITGLWPGSTLHCIESLRSPRWEDFEYTLDKDNVLSWLGNGWSSKQLEEGADLAYYLEPEFADIPQAPYPEKKASLRKLAFSH